jgi:hypothetical protein
MPFVKLDCKILDSTLWLDRDARDIFITALLMAIPWDTEVPMPQLDVNTMKPTGWEVPPGWYGFVPAAGPGIVRREGMDMAQGMAALVRLGTPEPESRSPSYEGRRLVRVSGGFVVLNYMIYREKDLTGAERTRRWRENKKRNCVTRHRDGVTPVRRVTVTQAEAEAEVRGATPPDAGIFKKQNIPLSCSELCANGAQTSEPKNGRVFLMTCRKGEQWQVPEKKIAEWEESYPDVDVPLTLLGIRQWLIDNPTKRKTARGMTRFIGAWMMGEQDKP